MITAQNILKHELIGLKTRIIESGDPHLLNMKGIIIDETKKTLILETNKGKKMIPKNIIRLRLTLPDGNTVKVPGGLLTGRPEERIKQRRRRW